MNLSPSDHSSSLNLSDTIECRLGLTVKDRVQVHNEEVKSTLTKAKREQLIQSEVSTIQLHISGLLSLLGKRPLTTFKGGLPLNRFLSEISIVFSKNIQTL